MYITHYLLLSGTKITIIKMYVDIIPYACDLQVVPPQNKCATHNNETAKGLVSLERLQYLQKVSLTKYPE